MFDLDVMMLYNIRTEVAGFGHNRQAAVGLEDSFTGWSGKQRV